MPENRDAPLLTPSLAIEYEVTRNALISQSGTHVLNPLLQDILRFCDPRTRVVYNHMAERLGGRGPNHGWTEMFVTQPPITRIALKTLGVARIGPPTTFELRDVSDGGLGIDNPSGVTVGDLAALIRKDYNTGDSSGVGEFHYEDYVKYAGVLQLADPEGTSRPREKQR